MAYQQWIDLTDDEILECAPINGATVESVAIAVAAKLKEKNTPPVVPQGEPVAWMDNDGNTCDHNEYGCFNIPLFTVPFVPKSSMENWADGYEIGFNTGKKATKEKAAKVLGEISLTQDELHSIESACSTSTECYRVVAKALKDKHAAAIRSMK